MRKAISARPFREEKIGCWTKEGKKSSGLSMASSFHFNLKTLFFLVVFLL
jgi:hypothetical protein